MNVRSLDPDTAAKRLRASFDAEDTVRFFTTRDDACLVSSKSNPGTWHYATEESCTCQWFTYRLHPCRHMARCSYELAQRRDARQRTASAS